MNEEIKITRKELDELKETMWNVWRYFCEPVLTDDERSQIVSEKPFDVKFEENLNLLKLSDPISKIKIQSKNMDGKRTWEIYIENDSEIINVINDRDGLKV